MEDAKQEIRANGRREGSEEKPRSFLGSILLAVIALLGLVGIALVTPYADLVLDQRLVEAHLSGSALTLLLLTVFVRWFLVRCGVALSWGEVLLVYSVWHFCAALPSSGFGGFLFPMMAVFRYFASPANQWQEFFGGFIPPWFAVSDLAAVQGFYHGVPSLSFASLQPWLAPTLFWLLFASVYFATHFCLALWLHQQWTVSEKLAFPTVQVAQAITALDDKHTLALFLLGLSVPFLIHSVNNLAQRFPLVPSVPFQFAWVQVFTEFPFDIWQGERTDLRFAALGMGYLIPSEVAISFWGFYWVHLFVKLWLRWRGFPPGVGTGGITTLQRAQEAGAFLVLATALLAPHARQTILHWHHTEKPVRWGFVGWLLGLSLLIAFLTLSGVSLIYAVAFFAIWTAVHLGLARIVNAGGVMQVECSFTPWDVLVRGVGVHRVGWRNLTVMAFPQQLFMFDQVTIPLPYLMDGLKLSLTAPFPLARFVSLLTVGYFVTMAVSLPFTFWLCHRWGALNLTPWFTQQEPAWAFHKLRSWAAEPFGVDVPFVQNMVIGSCVMAVLLYLHRHFLWWFLSPLGLVMSSTATLRNQWLSLFLGWFVHVMTLRLAGLKAYRSLRPFFLGCVWGEFLAHTFWVVVFAFWRR